MINNYLKLLMIAAIIAIPFLAVSQIRLIGYVRSAIDQVPLKGASVKIKNTRTGATTDQNGQFSIEVKKYSDTLIISYVGYLSKELTPGAETFVSYTKPLNILLEKSTAQLDEVVVSTGYYQVSKERATGSFTQINNELLNRSAGNNILNRLEGVTSSLHFDRRGTSGEIGQAPNLRVRGLSTIVSEQSPLIVVDNFPYEGKIENINPNDVESVTIMKDAAAASIWGARAGNGVIVITTKRGRYNQQASINFNSSVTIGNKPDLYYSREFLNSTDFIAVEQELFKRNYYTTDPTLALSPVVELLLKQKQGTITQAQADEQINTFKMLDIRKQARQYLYQKSLSQQFALNINGGSNTFKYYLSGGYDRNQTAIKGNNDQRITLNSTNTFKPTSKLEITVGINFQSIQYEQNGMGITALYPQSRLNIYPYAQIADPSGNALALEKRLRTTVVESSITSKLDWQYKPLEELKLNNQIQKNRGIRISTGAKYELLESLGIDLKYQYQLTPQANTNLRDKQSYYVRNLVNTYTLPDGSAMFPSGDILTSVQNEAQTHFARVQVNFSQIIHNDHSIVALGGAEIRQAVTTGNNNEWYGYNADILTYQSQLNYNTPYVTRPLGQQTRLPLPNEGLSSLTDRFISYYFNGSYSYKNRYSLSGSSRWDASNLFGVRTNQKGVPLWSAGASWKVSDEAFYKINWLPELKLRATYGTNGNVNKSVTAFPTAIYTTSPLTGLPSALLNSPGDPNLRWERIQISNIGLDFNLKKNRIGGSVEYYYKKGTDLIGDVLSDPTSGFIIERSTLATKRINYANMVSKGIDIDLQALLTDGMFKWNTILLFSYATNKITKYNSGEYNTTLTYLSTGIAPAKQGVSPDAFYSIPWNGLNPQTGGPLIYLNAAVSNDYTTYYNALKPADLINNGVSVPPYFGSLFNTFQWKKFELSINLTWKAGYYYRRSSINYNSLFSQWNGHADFTKRWQQPGDERLIQVPSMPVANDLRRDYVYTYSSQGEITSVFKTLA
jgi:TonB-linked SusC/RagA family outer membrane protein